MSLREKLGPKVRSVEDRFLDIFGVAGNPFPASNQTSGNPHYPIAEDDEAERRIAAFLRDGESEVLVIVGTQGVGKTNFLNYLESEIRDAELEGYYVVRYMADPEPSFDGTIRTIFQELGIAHLRKLVLALSEATDTLSIVRSYDLRQALLALVKGTDEQLFPLCLEWLFGFRVLNAHRHGLGVSFRLDTVESRTAVLRDYILLSVELNVLHGVFLLLDELEKQAGVLGPRAVVRYLSALRAIIDALPRRLFMIIAVTPDAMRRYGSALPAFRSRLENTIALMPLSSLDEAKRLAHFYVAQARKTSAQDTERSVRELITEADIEEVFRETNVISRRRGDEGIRQREFLNKLHNIAETRLQEFV